ncbi:MAG: hypothetical protein SFV23_24775 [Planctomycetaceae bacterium]|nr:hypothetical protein [Planctomycetaceae bacterium]
MTSQEREIEMSNLKRDLPLSFAGVRKESPNQVNPIATELDLAITKFLEAAAVLASEPSQSTAEEACLACRAAVEIFFFAFGDFGKSATTRAPELMAGLTTSEQVIRSLAAESADPLLLAEFADNIARRIALVQATLQNDRTRIRMLLSSGLDAA